MPLIAEGFGFSATGWVLVTLTALGFMVWLLLRVRAWFRDETDRAASDHEMLSRYRELHRRGELSDEEFRCIKDEMLKRLGKPVE